MVGITDIACLLIPLVMLVDSAFQTDLKTVKEAEKTGNFMEDEQWLSTISQYSRKIKHWNRFRDVSPAALTERRTAMRSKEFLLMAHRAALTIRYKQTCWDMGLLPLFRADNV